ncbi:hypothetical protein KIPB_008232, partial [Kipferlia bialata]
SISHWQLRNLVVEAHDTIYWSAESAIKSLAPGAVEPTLVATVPFAPTCIDATAVQGVLGHPDPILVAAGGQSAEVFVYGTAEQQGAILHRRVTASHDCINSVTFHIMYNSPPGLFISCNDCMVRMLDLPTGEVHSRLRFRVPVNGVAVHRTGRVAMVGDGRALIVGDSREMREEVLARTAMPTGVSMGASFSPCGTEVAVATQGGYVYVYDIRALRHPRLSLPASQSGPSGAYRAVQWLDRHIVGASEHDNMLHLFDVFNEEAVL